MNTFSSLGLCSVLLGVAAVVTAPPAAAQGAPTVTVRTSPTGLLNYVEAVYGGVFARDSLPPDTDVTAGFTLTKTEGSATASLSCSVQQVPFRLDLQHADTFSNQFATHARSGGNLVVTIHSNHPITGLLRLTRQWTGNPFGVGGALIFGGIIRASWNNNGNDPSSQQYDIPFAVHGTLDMEVHSNCWALNSRGSATESYVLEILSTQPAYDPNFGPGCGGSNGVPSLAPATGEAPILNGIFTCDVSNLPSGQAAFGLLGFLPVARDLTVIGAPGCVVHTDIAMLTALTNVGGSGTWSVSIPNDPGLFGLAFYQQVLTLDPGTNALGAVVSNCGMGVFGS